MTQEKQPADTFLGESRRDVATDHDLEDCPAQSNSRRDADAINQRNVEIKSQEASVGRWIGQRHSWTHFVTPTTHPISLLGRRPSVEFGLSFRAIIVQYYDTLSLDVYGRKKLSRPITHATSFECKSKYGNWTPWHAHSLVYVEPEFWEHFETKAVKLWNRRFCNRPDAIIVKRITHDKTTVASYSAKHDDADYGVEPLYSKEFKHSK